MDIEDAFTTEAIELSDTNVDAEQEEELRSVITRLCDSSGLEVGPGHVNAMILCFIGGRTFQSDLQVRPKTMLHVDEDTLSLILEYFASRIHELEGTNA